MARNTSKWSTNISVKVSSLSNSNSIYNLEMFIEGRPSVLTSKDFSLLTMNLYKVAS